MRYIFIIIAIYISGCIPPKEYTEQATIINKSFIPAHFDTVNVVVSIPDNNGIIKPTLTPVTNWIKDEYSITLQCQHGQFIINGLRAKEIYKQCENVDYLTIKYFDNKFANKFGKNIQHQF